MRGFTVNCCEGREDYPGQCLRERCPHYADARRRLRDSQTHSRLLATVKKDLAASLSECERAERLFDNARAYEGGMTGETGVWFRRHLAECKPCADLFRAVY